MIDVDYSCTTIVINMSCSLSRSELWSCAAVPGLRLTRVEQQRRSRITELAVTSDLFDRRAHSLRRDREGPEGHSIDTHRRNVRGIEIVQIAGCDREQLDSVYRQLGLASAVRLFVTPKMFGPEL